MNDHSAHTHNEPSPGDGGSSEPPKPLDANAHPRHYFLPGKIIVHVNHPVGSDPRVIADSINGTVQKEKLGFPLGITGFEGSLIKNVRPMNILSFPGRDNQGSTFSIVPIELRSHRQDHLITILKHIYDQLHLQDSSFDPKDGLGITWRSVSPNWLLGSAGHGSPHPPSPGSWPLARKALKKEDWKFSLFEKDSGKTRPWPNEFANKGANVHVAILDTAPCANDLDEAYETWQEENGLIEQLLKPEPQRKLRLVTDIYAEIELLDCSLAGHRYWMADHGLFIAGEIASIAPESKIHLIKVFTSYGSASTLTLAQGLIRVLNDEEIGRPLIVNCSFGLAAPVPGQEDSDFPIELRNPANNFNIEERMRTSLQVLFDELTNQTGVIVVASAGDDTDPDPISNPSRQRVPARFPAAYERVIGVGALPKGFPRDESDQFETARYSNFADNPSDTGYVTLGGEPGRGKGIVGLYIYEFPDYLGAGGKPPKDPKESTRDHLKYSPNEGKGEGSAEWAGASFAAPIVTGILARWCGEQFSNGGPITPDAARTALDNLSQGETTNADERVILVKQEIS